MLDPSQFPKLILLSLLASLAVGAIVWRLSQDGMLALMVTAGLLIADWLGLRNLMK